MSRAIFWRDFLFALPARLPRIIGLNTSQPSVLQVRSPELESNSCLPEGEQAG